MSMIWPRINVKLFHLRPAKRVARDHTLNSFNHYTLRMLPIQNFVRGPAFDTARVTRMPIISFITSLVASETNFLSVNNDNIITAIDMRCEQWFMLATKSHRHNASKTAKNQAFGVNHEPIPLNFKRFL